MILATGNKRGLLRDAGYDDIRLALPDVADAQRRSMPAATGAAADLYTAAKDLPVLRELLLAVGPLLLATAVKPAGRP